MKARLKQLPWLTLGAGILGAGLCLLFHSVGTDDRGLLPSSNPILTLIYALIGIVLVLLFLNLRKAKDAPAYKMLFPASKLSLIGCIAASAGIVVDMIETAQQSITLLVVLEVIFGGLSGICLLFLGYFRLKSLRPHYLFHSIVAIYLTLQLLVQYQDWNTQPQIISYMPQLMAMVFLMLSTYHRAALDAGSGKCWSYSFFSQGALFFCCLAAVGPHWPFFLGMAVWTFTGQCSQGRKSTLARMELPEEVLYCIDTLEHGGYSAYCVGGCVRDYVLGLTPSDFDLCTSATPEQVCALFARHKLVRNGEKHGTIGVVVADKLYEITTFRTEGGYSDTRHPDWVEFVTDLQQDLARRDFTINAMAYSPSKGLVDPFGGRQDLENKILRAVGNPETRFREDALRILRGVRFGVRFNLSPEEKTRQAMENCAPLMDQLARERVSSELCKLLPLISQAQMISYRSIITQVIPELAEGKDGEDAYAHTAAVVDAVPSLLPVRMAALLHSLAEETAQDVLLRLKISNALCSQVLPLIQLQTMLLPTDKKLLRPILGTHGEETIRLLIKLQKAITQISGQDTADLDMVELLLDTLHQDGSCLSVKDLALTGSDLLELGAVPGPHIGRCMQWLLNMVQDEVLANTKEELLDAAKTFLEL